MSKVIISMFYTFNLLVILQTSPRYYPHCRILLVKLIQSVYVHKLSRLNVWACRLFLSFANLLKKFHTTSEFLT